MSRVATYSQPFMRARGFLGTLGDSVCFDASGNAVDCSSPDVANSFNLTPQQQAFSAAAYTPPAGSIYDIQYGSPGVAPSADTYAHQAAIQAGNVAPSSSYSGITQAITSALTPGSVPRPSPTVSVPLSTSTIGVWASNNMGTIAIIGVVVVVVGSLLGGKRRR